MIECLPKDSGDQISLHDLVKMEENVLESCIEEMNLSFQTTLTNAHVARATMNSSRWTIELASGAKLHIIVTASYFSARILWRWIVST